MTTTTAKKNEIVKLYGKLQFIRSFIESSQNKRPQYFDL